MSTAASRNAPGAQSDGFDPLASESAVVLVAEGLLEEAERAGAGGAEVFAARTQAVSVCYQKGDLELTQVDERTELGLTVLADGKTGFASTNQSSAKALRSTAGDAVRLARLSLADPHAGLNEPGLSPTRLRLVHKDLASWSLERCIGVARELVESTLAIDPRLTLDRASVTLSRRSVAVRSSTGVHACSSDVELSCSLFGMAVEGADVGGSDSGWESVRDPGRWHEHAGACATRFAGIALGNLGALRAESYRGPVLFAPQAFLSIFVAPLVSAASGLAVQRGRSALAGKLGTRIASPELTLVDDPLDPELHGAAAFDREGTATRELAIVRKGVLESFLYNGYAARVEGRRSSGHATGGARSLPGLGAHALCVASGTGGSPGVLMQQMGRGLFVQRFSGSVDPATGDFSGVAKSARWIEDGVPVRSVRETLISGNSFALLAGGLCLSDPPERVMASALVPWALVDGLSVTAG